MNMFTVITTQLSLYTLNGYQPMKQWWTQTDSALLNSLLSPSILTRQREKWATLYERIL